ncbi:MAG: response regulator [Lachnospiraceae bacterium]
MYTYVVIDDEQLTRKGTQKKLEALSDRLLCVGEAENGASALTMISETDPDIIITDMNMPIMDGTQLLPLLSERFPEKQIIVISGYKDFEYMKQAISAKAVDYILKPFSREILLHTMLDAIKRIEAHCAINSQIVISKEKQEESKYELDIQMLKNQLLGHQTDTLTLASQRLHTMNETHHFVLISMYVTSAITAEHLQNFLSENSFGDLALFLEHTTNSHIGFFILFVPSAGGNVNRLCRQVTEGLYQMFLENVQTALFGISEIHASLSDLHTAYNETIHALNSKTLGDSKGYYYPYLTAPESVQYNWPKQEEFLFRVETGDQTAMEQLLDDLFSFFSKSENFTLYDVKVYCFLLSSQTTALMSHYFKQVDPSSGNSSMQNILNSMFSLDEIQQYYLQFYDNITAILKEHTIYASKDTIEKIKIYIQKHYYNNITIEFLSSLFYMNRSYLSHLFKSKTGDTFVNYLNSVRIERAKTLLLTTDKKMYQISKSVGYDNTKYFFRVFKKGTGKTPEQFRLNS